MKIAIGIAIYLVISFAFSCFIGKVIKFGGSTAEE